MNMMKRATLVWAAAALAAALPGCSLFRPEPTPGTATAPAAPSPSAPAPPRARPAPLPPLQPRIDEAEEGRLRDRASRAIDDAERAAQAVRPGDLAPVGRETLASVQSFVAEARQALAGRDYERATTLARKAETLAKDLRTSAR